MNRAFQYIRIIFPVFLLLNGSVAFAQASFEGLGDLASGLFSSSAWGVSGDGSVVVGDAISDSGTQAFRWQNDVMTPLGDLPGGNFFSFARRVSGDGSVVVGGSVSASCPQGAFLWQINVMTGLGDLNAIQCQSWAYGVSGDGSVVVGRGLSQDPNTGLIRTEAFRWTASGGMVGLGDLSGSVFGSQAFGISANGLVVVGRGESTLGQEAFRWQNDVMTALGDLPLGDFKSDASDVSADGSVVVGRGETASGEEAFRWENNIMTPLGFPSGSDESRARAVSDDGLTVVGRGRSASGDQAFIWDAVNGMRLLQDVLVNDYGLDLTGWTLTDARDVAEDGTVIVGAGINPSGDQEAWRAVIRGPSITVTSPLAGELWIAGEQDTIRWEVAGIDFVDISYSLDGGTNFNDAIVLGYPADSAKFVWDIPDTLLSRKCIIQINDPSSAFSTQSGLFKIKGYELTRIDENGDYKRFTPGEDGWNFANTPTNMWPPGWYNQPQVDYINGIDPFTMNEYPFFWPFFPIFAESNNFPDWPLFVEAFGIDQCYFDDGFGLIYRWSALYEWVMQKDYWEGSCHGFAVSSLLAFVHKEEFIKDYLVEEFINLNDLSLDANSRIAVNKAWTRQLGQLPSDNSINKWNTSPNETLAELKEMLLNELQDEGALLFFEVDPEDNPGGHSVTPIRITKDPNNQDIEYIEIYDNNHPNTSKTLTIDKVANTWLHTSGWDGDAHMWIDVPSEVYLQNAILSSVLNPSVPVLSRSHSKSSVGNSFIKFYNSTSLSISITNSTGETIGFDNSDSSLVYTLLSAIPLIPLTGYPHPPIGYYVPEDNYSVEMGMFLDSVAYFSISRDSLSYTYGRADAEFNQTDLINTSGGISVGNPDNVSKIMNVASIVTEESNEKVIDILNVKMIQDDSLQFTVLDNNKFKMTNFTSNTSYDLRLRLASAVGEDLFEYSKIDIESNSSHLIVPDWQDLPNQPVKILIDADNDGTIDDTLTVANQVTGIKDQGSLTVPQEYHLAQNYPNPFNPETALRFHLPQAEHVSIRIFNTLGQEVKILVDDQYPAGIHRAIWDATDKTGNRVSSGVYIYQIQAGTFAQAKKMLLLR